MNKKVMITLEIEVEDVPSNMSNEEFLAEIKETFDPDNTEMSLLNGFIYKVLASQFNVS